jgi:hypothetical protein
MKEDLVWYIDILEKSNECRILIYKRIYVFRTRSSDTPVTRAAEWPHVAWQRSFPEH